MRSDGRYGREGLAWLGLGLGLGGRKCEKERFASRVSLSTAVVRILFRRHHHRYSSGRGSRYHHLNGIAEITS